MRSEHISVEIGCPADEVYAYASDPRNLPLWAAGLANGSIESSGDVWLADSPMGRITIRFAPANPYGVLDHEVTEPSGATTANPMRVVPIDRDSCELVFTIRQRPGMSDDQFRADAEAVAADLATLRGLLESRAT